jgi:hypothetical protein
LTTRYVEAATAIFFVQKKKRKGKREKECLTRRCITNRSIREQQCLDADNRCYYCC